MRRFLCVLSAGIVLSATAIGWAEDAKTADQKPGPEIRKLLADIEENFSRGDANGVAACWTPTGDFVGPAGERIAGRGNIEKAFGKFFADHKDVQMKLQPTAFRMVNEGLALVDALSEVKPAPPGGEGDALLSLVLVKGEQGWRIESAGKRDGRAPAQAPQLKDWNGWSATGPASLLRPTASRSRAFAIGRRIGHS